MVDKLLQRFEKVKTRLKADYKNVKPFRMEPMSNEEMLIKYDMMAPEQHQELIQTYGVDSYNEMVSKMEKIRARRVK